eukprot:14278615-Alexandrium_andersonii.AAC.1
MIPVRRPRSRGVRGAAVSPPPATRAGRGRRPSTPLAPGRRVQPRLTFTPADRPPELREGSFIHDRAGEGEVAGCTAVSYTHLRAHETSAHL